MMVYMRCLQANAHNGLSSSISKIKAKQKDKRQEQGTQAGGRAALSSPPPRGHSRQGPRPPASPRRRGLLIRRHLSPLGSRGRLESGCERQTGPNAAVEQDHRWGCYVHFFFLHRVVRRRVGRRVGVAFGYALLGGGARGFGLGGHRKDGRPVGAEAGPGQDQDKGGEGGELGRPLDETGVQAVQRRRRAGESRSRRARSKSAQTLGPYSRSGGQSWCW